MKDLLLLTGILFFANLSAQDIPYTVNVIDLNTEPSTVKTVDEQLEAPGGVYLNCELWDGTVVNTISFFDGTSLNELYESEEELRLAGATSGGVYVLEDISDESFMWNLLFINRSGSVRVLSPAGLRAPKVHQMGDDLFTFNSITGFRRFSTNGANVLLDDEFRIASSLNIDPFYEFGEQLTVRLQGGGFLLTDGTNSGTRKILEGTSNLYEYDGKLFATEAFDISVYDPGNGSEINLSEDLPNIPEGLVQLGNPVVTETGLLFTAKSSTQGWELFISDGTKEGTTRLMEINEGSADGIDVFGNLRPAVIEGHMIFTNADESNPGEVWISDGTDAGTFPIITVTDPNMLLFGILRGVTLPSGEIFIVVHEGNVGLEPTYIYALNSENQGVPATIVDILDFTYRGELVNLNNRLLIARTTSGIGSLLSIGTTPGDIDTLGIVTTNSEETVLRTPDLFFYPFQEFGSDTLFLTATRGMAEDMTTIIASGTRGNTDYPILFSIGEQLYTYVFDLELGESIHSINLSDLTSELVLDLYQDTEGRAPKELYRIRDKLLIDYDDFDGEETLLFGGLPSEIISLDRGARPRESDQMLGNSGDEYFFGFREEISAINLVSGEIRALSMPLTANALSNGNWTPLNNKIYKIFSESLSSPSRRVFNFYEYDLLTETVTRLSTDTTTNTNLSRRKIATDGELLYFTHHTESSSEPAYYDPATGLITDFSNPTNEEIVDYQRIGDSVVFELDDFFDRGPSYWITREGIGSQIDLGLGSGNHIDFGSFFLFVTDEGGRLNAVTKVTGESVLLFLNAKWVTDIGNGEAVFFYRNFMTDEWELWETDGTDDGTRLITVMEDLPFNGPRAVQFWEGAVAIIPDFGTLQLYDPVAEQLETVGVALQNLNADLVPLGNRLYFVADHPVFGAEVHYLKLAGSDIINIQVFRDDNGSGTREASEEGIPNVRISVDGGNLTSLYTGPDGRVLTGAIEEENYSFAMADLPCFESFTTPSSYSLTYTSNNEYLLSFGVQPRNGPAALRTLLNSGTIRCGFEHDFWLTVLNDGCQPVAGEGSVTYPEEMAFLESDETPTSNEDHTLTFAFDTLQPGASRQFRIRFRMPDENFAGQDINLGAAAGAITVDGAMVESDTFAYSEVLRCAIDPNDKQVAPSRPEPSNSNYTQIDETLRYTIRFQNTGNDTAFTVRIEDQISESLVLESLKPLAASHPYSVSVRENRTVVFLFEDILLPDSTTNLPGSQGFVTFEINAHPDLEDFSTIDNTAGIYFDFNQPVITNTVTSTLVEFLDEDSDGFLFYDDCDDTNRNINPNAEEIPNNGIDENCDDLDDFPVSSTQALQGTLRCFPNPTNGLLALTYTNNTLLNGELYSASGARLRKFNFQKTHNLNLSALPAGLYLIRLYSPEEGKGVVIRVVRE